jgi:uncharacterized membrane protein YhaH (DUF805 family)
VDAFPRFVGLWILTVITLLIAIAGVAVQLHDGQRTGAVLLVVWVIVMGAGVVTVTVLRRRLRP